MPFNFIALMAVLSLILTAVVVATACGVIVALLAINKLSQQISELEDGLTEDYNDFADSRWDELDYN